MITALGKTLLEAAEMYPGLEKTAGWMNGKPGMVNSLLRRLGRVNADGIPAGMITTAPGNVRTRGQALG